MEALFLLVGVLLLILGLVGCVLPIVPGPPIAFLALIVRQFTLTEVYSLPVLLFMAVFVAVVTFLDFIIPVWGTKKFGGTKYGTRGAAIGLIIGIIFTPFGLISVMIGPFLGAFIGESLGGMPPNKALMSGVGAFMGFLAGTFMKVATTLFICALFFFPGLI